MAHGATTRQKMWSRPACIPLAEVAKTFARSCRPVTDIVDGLREGRSNRWARPGCRPPRTPPQFVAELPNYLGVLEDMRWRNQLAVPNDALFVLGGVFDPGR